MLLTRLILSAFLTILLCAPTSAAADELVGLLANITPSRSEPTQLVDGNELTMEHRFFLPSRLDPVDWRDLTIFQAATDHHRVIQALKVVYSGRWLTWSAEPFTLGPRTGDSFAYLVPGANHSARIVQLPLEQRDEAITAIRRWAGVETATAAGMLRVEPLDRVYDVEATQPR